jgi:hypothetical protein
VKADALLSHTGGSGEMLLLTDDTSNWNCRRAIIDAGYVFSVLTES